MKERKSKSVGGLSTKLHSQRLKSINDPRFSEAWALYQRSFPLSERRKIDLQQEIFNESRFYFNVFHNGEQLIGLLNWWVFEDYLFVDHFCTDEKCRGKGLGAQMMKQLQYSTKKPLLLEVEVPDSPMKIRRVRFYQRLGFHLNKYTYQQPPFHAQGECVDLQVMSYPDPLSAEMYQKLTTEGHQLIYP